MGLFLESIKSHAMVIHNSLLILKHCFELVKAWINDLVNDLWYKLPYSSTQHLVELVEVILCQLHGYLL